MEKLFENNFRFIDLFAGIGGFHQALSKLGGSCVYAAEINPETAKVYEENYKISALRDIKKVKPEEIPQHDVLCAGFPCQSFSKAGMQKGFNDVRGTLFFDIVRILKYHIRKFNGPRYVLLENVRNLVSHDKGRTWVRIRCELENIGYNVIETPLIVSPHYFGIPQLRERAVIVAVKKDFYNRKIVLNIEKKQKNTCDMRSILINRSNKEYNLKDFKITPYEEKVLEMWDLFIKGIDKKIIGFPIWSDCFHMDFGNIDNNMPERKKSIIKKNIDLYQNNKIFIDKWLEKFDNLTWCKKTHRKFEWQVDDKIKSVFDGIIQFRPSGVRVKQPTEFPALVAIVHIPIVGKYRRYITPREAANLQSFPNDFIIDKNIHSAYKQFGNAVNVDVIYNVFKQFVDLVEGNTYGD